MKHRLDGRSYSDRQGRPFYGSSLRRVLAPEPTDPSWLDRILGWWYELEVREARFLALVILLAVFCAAVIVIL